MKFEKLQPGMVVYSVGKTTMGNTTLKTVSVWPVRIVSVDPLKRTVVATWNGNQAKSWTESTYSQWKDKPPVLVGRPGGPKRLATPAERKALEEAKAASAVTASAH